MRSVAKKGMAANMAAFPGRVKRACARVHSRLIAIGRWFCPRWFQSAVRTAISFDPATGAAVDAISGMSVAFAEYDHPQEQRAFYKLVWRGRESVFTAASDPGFHKLRRENPSLGLPEIMQMLSTLHQLEYNIKLPKNLLTDIMFLGSIDTFIELLAENTRRRLTSYTITVVFDPYGVDKAFPRKIKYPPLLPAS